MARAKSPNAVLFALCAATAILSACNKSDESGRDAPSASAPAASAPAASAPAASAPAVAISDSGAAPIASAAAPAGADASAPPAAGSAAHAASAAPPASGSASPVKCGAKTNPCPLQAWMQTNANPAVSSGDAAGLAKVLDDMVKLAPPGYPNWASISKDGAAAARANDITAAKASCRSCHDQYKAKYKAEIRDRKI